MIEISIIIPCYQKSKTLVRCLESISFKDIQVEILLVDDGSSPPVSINEAKKYPHLRVIRQENAGPGAARNRGAAEAVGRYLLFLDADDFLHPNFEKIITPHIAKNWGVIIGGFHYLGKSTSHLPYLTGEKNKEGLLPVSQMNQKSFRRACDFFAAGACLIRREIFQKTKGYYAVKKVLFGEDIYLWLQVMLFCPEIYRLSDILVMVDDNYSSLGVGKKGGKPISALALCPASEFFPLCLNKSRKFLNKFLGLYRQEVSTRLIYENRYGEFFVLGMQFPHLLFSWPLLSFLIKRILVHAK